MKANFYMFMFIVTVACAMLLGANMAAMSATAHAATEPLPSNVEECVPIGTAGNQTVYRCEDWQVGKLVYVNNFGFLFAVDE